jgi:hypothetical protein
MKPKFFIFPCQLTDQQFEVISEIRDLLNAQKLVLCKCQLKNPDSKLLRIDLIVNDLSEVLKNGITHGWRYNSYVLNLAIVKLDYCLTLINLELGSNLFALEVNIQHSLETLQQILSDSYIDFMQENV